MNAKISLQATFLEDIDEIDKDKEYFFSTNYEEDYPYDDLRTNYIEAKYKGAETPLMATILYPKNDSDVTQSFPEISKRSGLNIIGDNDFL